MVRMTPLEIQSETPVTVISGMQLLLPRTAPLANRGRHWCHIRGRINRHHLYVLRRHLKLHIRQRLWGAFLHLIPKPLRRIVDRRPSHGEDLSILDEQLPVLSFDGDIRGEFSQPWPVRRGILLELVRLQCEPVRHAYHPPYSG